MMYYSDIHRQVLTYQQFLFSQTGFQSSVLFCHVNTFYLFGQYFALSPSFDWHVFCQDLYNLCSFHLFGQYFANFIPFIWLVNIMPCFIPHNFDWSIFCHVSYLSFWLVNILPCFIPLIFDWSVFCHVSYLSFLIGQYMVQALHLIGQYFAMFHAFNFLIG